MNQPTSLVSKAVWLSRFGPALEVTEVRETLVPELGAHEVAVKLDFAPINPADLNVLEGKYGALPTLPAVPGIEGVAVVMQTGRAVDPSLVGKRVLLPHGFGSWRQTGVLAAQDLIVVPEDVPLEQAAILRINPATAWCMLNEFKELKAGDWVVQNAANSGVGRAVIQIARACGWRTLNVVRRSGLEVELRSIGADAVVEEGEQLSQRIAVATGGVQIALGLNAVGGESALGMAKALAEGATLVTYGAMSLQPLRIPNGLLIFKDLAFRGFWVSKWFQKATPETRDALFARLFEWAASGVLHTPIEAVYPLEKIHLALEHASRSMRTGKILLQG
ncbi:MAG: 2-enoyl thioester reductase domain-containing protein [Chthoniobacteraceae bacterium]|nr:2-enoyl thioester reductase domain-containing protein [Chthoniobacteraceae bacterium]